MNDVLDFLNGLRFDAGGAASALEILLRVTILVLAAALVALALRRKSAALRHLVWILALVGTLLIPLCYWAFPAWQWAILPHREPTMAAAVPSAIKVVNDAPTEVPLQPAYNPQPLNLAKNEYLDVPAAPQATVAEPLAVTPPVTSPQAWSWPTVLAVLWAVGTACGLVWLAVGVVAAWYVARRAQPAADLDWHSLLRQLLTACNLRRPVEVRQCRHVSIPMTWGLRRPVILIPADGAAWSDDIKRSVLLHELGHIRRGDCLMHLLGRLACVAYWFHPLVWLAARQLRKTSEQAADDAVLASNIAPPDYAQHLVGIAGQMRGLHLFGHVALPMASPSDLEGRVLAILDPQRNRRSLRRKTFCTLMVLAAMFLLPCAVLRLGYAENRDEQTASSPPNGPEPESAEKNPIDSPPVPVPVKADAGTTLDSILNRLAQEEKQYDSLEVTATTVYRYLNLQENLVGDTFVTCISSETRERNVFAGDCLYHEEKTRRKMANDTMQSSLLRQAYDGQCMRQHRQDISTDAKLKLDGWTSVGVGQKDDLRLLRAHTILFHNDRINGQLLSSFLASERYDKGDGHAMTVEYVGDEMVNDLHCHKLKCALPRRGKVTRFFFVWLARDRGLLAVRHQWHEQWHELDHSEDIPTGISFVEDLREVSPGQWFPFKAAELRYQEFEGQGDSQRPLQWRRDTRIDRVTLAPQPDDTLFSVVEVPKDTLVCVLDSHGERIGTFKQPQTGNLELNPDRLQEAEAQLDQTKDALARLSAAVVSQPQTPTPAEPPPASQSASSLGAATLSGQVVDHENKPVKDARVLLPGPGSLLVENGNIVDWGSSVNHQTEGELSVGNDDPSLRRWIGNTRRDVVETDADGRFRINAAGRDVTHIIVLAPRCYVWAVPVPAEEEREKELTIRLPKPATLKVMMDIPGAIQDNEKRPLNKLDNELGVKPTDEAWIRLQPMTSNAKGWRETDNFIQTRAVANPGEVVFENLPPGVYDFARTKLFTLGVWGQGGFCDRQLNLELASGETKVIRLVRQRGQRVSGEIRGLPEDVPGAWLKIHAAADATGDWQKMSDDWKLPVFDYLTCKNNAKFLTSLLEPGQYKIVAHGYRPEPKNGVVGTGIHLPDFIGTMLVAVQDDDPADAKKPVPFVAIEMKPRQPITLPPAKPPLALLTVPGTVVDENEQPVAGVSVRALTGTEHEPVAESDAQGCFQLRLNRDQLHGLRIIAHSTDGVRQAFFEFAPYFEPGAALPPVRLTMRPARSIDVQVVDGEGKPIPDAAVGAVAYCRGFETGSSDVQGKFLLRIPSDAPLQNVYAFKSGLGLDYCSFPQPDRTTTGDEPQPPDISNPLILKLNGAKTVRIKLIDPEGRPIEGVRVAPWFFQKPEWGRRDNLNVSGAPYFQRKTDDDGVAVFDWIPAWNKDHIVFWPSECDQWTRTRITWNPEKDPPEKTEQLERTVPVRGQVRYTDGSPAAGIVIQAKGSGHASLDGFQGQARTDANGRFEIRVNPGCVYLFVVSDNEWAATPQSGINVSEKSDAPVANIDFQLVQPTTKLHGQLTLGTEEQPWARQTVTLTQRAGGQESTGLSISRWAGTDAEGRYAFAIGPGEYTISAANSTAEQNFTVNDQKELVYDFHVPREPRGMITVRVMNQSDPSRPVPHATVVGISVSSMHHANLEATTNDNGWFRVERWLDKMIVCAHSKDSRLAGTVTIMPDDTEVTIPLQPIGSAQGQVIDQATGQAAAGKTIECGVSYRYELPKKSGLSTYHRHGSVTTDAEGQFEIRGLVPGVEYQLKAPLSKETDSVELPDYDSLGTVTVKGGETVDLGNVKFRRELSPGELLDVVLENRDPLDRRLKGMANDEHKGLRRALIMFWNQTDETSRRHLTEITHNDFKHFGNYGVVSSSVDQKQMESAKAAYGTKWASVLFAESWPLFCILDVDGRTLAVKNTQEFVKDGKVDDSLVNEFLKQYAMTTTSSLIDADKSGIELYFEPEAAK